MERRRPDLLLALDEHPHVARQRARRREPGAHRVRVRNGPRLVVGRAPSVEATVALLGFERIARPVLDDPGRLDVVMRVQQHRGRVRPRMHPLAEDERL